MKASGHNGLLEHPKIILSHATAMSYYKMLDPYSEGAAKPTSDNPLPKAVATKCALRGVNRRYPAFMDGPFEALVGSSDNRHTTSEIRVHTCERDLPPGSFWKSGEWLYFVCPELCFVQMANLLSEAQLVRFGFDLCARRYSDPQTNKLKKRDPLSSVASIAGYLDALRGLRGIPKAKRALRLVKDRSDSPMESDLAMLISYPKGKGGYGLSGFEMGYKVDPERYAYLVEQDYFEIDIAFPEKHVGVEYFGEYEHPDQVKDRRRLDALEALGWHMVVVDKQRLYSPSAFAVAMNQIAKHLGIRFRLSEDWKERMRDLRVELGLLKPESLM